MDLYVNFPLNLVVAGHDKEGGQNVMGKTCHKHVMLVIYVRKNKIRSMGNKIIMQREE